jgi:hypothetical protein
MAKDNPDLDILKGIQLVLLLVDGEDDRVVKAPTAVGRAEGG